MTPSEASSALAIVTAHAPLGPVVIRGDASAVVASWASDPRAVWATEDFLSGTINNPHTREAYGRAVRAFVAWCERRPTGRLELAHVTPKALGDYLAELARDRSAPTVKAHLSGLRHWFDKLVLAHVLPFSPAHSVRGPKFRRRTGATPWLVKEDARRLFRTLDAAIAAEDDAPAQLVALRDRALLAVMLYAFGRVSATVGMTVRDYMNPGAMHARLRFHEKRGRVHEVPANTSAMRALDAWLAASGLAQQPASPLFPATTGGRAQRLTCRPLTRIAAWRTVKRWCAAAEISPDICNHSFRATGITMHGQAGGDIKQRQQLAGHADMSTTMLYDHSGDELQRAEVEMVRL